MNSFYITTSSRLDSIIEANSADEAAAGFAADESIPGVLTVVDLTDYLKRTGESGAMQGQDGRTIFVVE